jgi:hypothetical protein
MTWLKEWDKCVFKRVPPKKRKADDEDNGYAVSVPTSIPAPPANSANSARLTLWDVRGTGYVARKGKQSPAVV